MIPLKELRKEAKMTQVELAERSGLAQSVIAAIETGTCKNPRIGTLLKLAKGLDCSLGCLILDKE